MPIGWLAHEYRPPRKHAGLRPTGVPRIASPLVSETVPPDVGAPQRSGDGLSTTMGIMTDEWQLMDERRGWAGHLPLSVRQYRLPDGSTADWDIFGGARTVAVLAITSAGEVVLARQFRPGPGRVLDELPGGYVDDGEDVAAAAARELAEETGYAGSVSVVGRSWLASACRTERFIAVTTDARPVGPAQNEDGEFCEVVLLPLGDFRTHLRSGQLTDVDLGYLALDHLGMLGNG